MLAFLLSACVAQGNSVERRDVARAVRKELSRMYMMQTFLGPYAPYFMLFGKGGLPLFNGANMGNINPSDLFEDADDDENIAGKDVRRAVRRELSRMYLLQLFLSQLPQPNGQFNFENFQGMPRFPFASANTNEDYYDYDDNYDYYYDYYD